MSSKQLKARLDKLTTKIKSRQAELATFRTQQKEIRDQLTTARAAEKAKKAAAAPKK